VLKKIAKVLINTKNSECLKKAESLEIETPQIDTLNLRNLGLKAIDISAIANILKQEKNNNAGFIKSISFSYNDLIGDIGATEIVRSLPSSICEIGLVGCGIGDKGGNEILEWIKTLPNLKMICIEQNSFSDNLKTEFNMFKKNNPKIMVVI
jgi:hypothetical protein